MAQLMIFLNSTQHVACCVKHGLHRHTAWTDGDVDLGRQKELDS